MTWFLWFLGMSLKNSITVFMTTIPPVVHSVIPCRNFLFPRQLFSDQFTEGIPLGLVFKIMREEKKDLPDP